MTLQEFLDRCAQLKKSGNPAGCMAFCDEILAAEAKGRLRAPALRQKAVLLLASELGAHDAITYLKAALTNSRSYPSDQPAILSTLISAYAMYGNHDDARQYADMYFRLAESSADPTVRQWVPKFWFNLGYAYETAAEHELAAEAYTNARETAHLAAGGFNRGLAENNLVQMYLELGRIEDAMLMMEAAKAHLGDVAEASPNLKDQEAQCLLAVGRLQEADAACLEALAHPECQKEVRAEALLTHARIQAAQGDVAQAITTAEQALDIARDVPNQRLIHKIGGFLATLRAREEVPRS